MVVFEPPYKVGDDFKARHITLYHSIGTSVEVSKSYEISLNELYCYIILHHVKDP